MTACGLDLDPVPVSERIQHPTCPACAQRLYGQTTDAPADGWPDWRLALDKVEEIRRRQRAQGVYSLADMAQYRQDVGDLLWERVGLLSEIDGMQAAIRAACKEMAEWASNMMDWVDKGYSWYRPQLVSQAGKIYNSAGKLARRAGLNMDSMGGKLPEAAGPKQPPGRRLRMPEAKAQDMRHRYNRSDCIYIPSAGQATQDVKDLLYERDTLLAEIAELQAMPAVLNIMPGALANEDPELAAFVLLNGIVHDTRSRGGAQAPDYVIHARNVLRWKTVDGNPPADLWAPAVDQANPTLGSLHDLLLLVGYDIPEEAIREWPDETQEAVSSWASARYARAGDCDVKVPIRPGVLELYPQNQQPTDSGSPRYICAMDTCRHFGLETCPCAAADPLPELIYPPMQDVPDGAKTCPHMTPIGGPTEPEVRS
jgi:hypothetical protein